METLFGLQTQNYEINRYLFKRLENGRMLVTTDHGGWALLSPHEFELLKKERVQEDPFLFKNLEEVGILITDNNKDRILEWYRRRYGYVSRGVTLHIISPTLRCNHNCIYCHAKSKPLKSKGFDMDRKTAKKVVDFIFQTPAKSFTIEFQGGECLTNFSIVQYIIEYSKKKKKETHKDVKFSLVSNFTLMDHDILKYLIKNRVSLCTSLDGPKELHNKNRRILGDGGPYEKVSYWIHEIKNNYNYDVGALMTTTRFSLSYGKEIVDTYREHGFNHVRIRHLLNAGYASTRWKRIGYTDKEFLNFWKEVVEYCFRLNMNGIEFHEGMCTLIAKKFLFPDDVGYTCWCAPCGSAISQLAYDYDGRIYACDESRSFDVFNLGTVETSYKEFFEKSEALNILDLSSLLSYSCDDCVWKPFCGICLVSLYGEQKNFVPKIPLHRECKIRKGMIEYVFEKLNHRTTREFIMNWAQKRSF